MDKKIQVLNDRLLRIFHRKLQRDPAAYYEYFKLLTLEAAYLLFRFGKEEAECPKLAKEHLRAILKMVTPARMPEIQAKGAFVWWMKQLRKMIAPYYGDD